MGEGGRPFCIAGRLLLSDRKCGACGGQWVESCPLFSRRKSLGCRLMITRSFALCAGLLLSACASQSPSNEFGVCLGDVEELTELKSLVRRTAAKYRLEVDDYSQSVKGDLDALDSALPSTNLFALILKDTRWRSETGQVMINNIGRFAPTAVSVSMFQNDALLGNDQNAAAFRNDLVSAASARWKIIDASSSDGTYHECSR